MVALTWRTADARVRFTIGANPAFTSSRSSSWSAAPGGSEGAMSVPATIDTPAWCISLTRSRSARYRSRVAARSSGGTVRSSSAAKAPKNSRSSSRAPGRAVDRRGAVDRRSAPSLGASRVSARAACGGGRTGQRVAPAGRRPDYRAAAATGGTSTDPSNRSARTRPSGSMRTRPGVRPLAGTRRGARR